MKRTLLNNLDQISSLAPNSTLPAKKKVYFKILVWVLPIIFVIAYLVFFQRIQNVYFNITFAKIDLLTKQLQDKKLIFTSESQLREIINRFDAQLKIIKIEKIYPHTLKIDFDSQEAKYLLVESSKKVIISDMNRVLMISRGLDSSFGVNLITINSDIMTGFDFYKVNDLIVDKSLINTLQVLKILESKNIELKEININPNSLLKLKTPKFNLLLPLLDENFPSKISQLSVILDQGFGGELKQYQEIDLRFEKVVLK